MLKNDILYRNDASYITEISGHWPNPDISPNLILIPEKALATSEKRSGLLLHQILNSTNKQAVIKTTRAYHEEYSSMLSTPLMCNYTHSSPNPLY